MGRLNQGWSQDVGSYERRRNGRRQKRMEGDNGNGNGPKWPWIKKKKIIYLFPRFNITIYIFIVIYLHIHSLLFNLIIYFLNYYTFITFHFFFSLPQRGKFPWNNGPARNLRTATAVRYYLTRPRYKDASKYTRIYGILYVNMH